MGSTITVASLIGPAKTILHDEGATRRWSDDDLTGFLNDAQRDICFLKPDANVLTAAVQLVAGTKQSIPTAGFQLIKVIRNMGAAGTTPGKAVSIIDQSVMDAMNPLWHAATGVATVDHYMMDIRNPRVFWVYPPQPSAGMGYVDMAYASLPSTATTTITLDDIFANAILLYMLYKAYSVDMAISQDAFARAIGYWNQFVMLIGRKDLIERSFSPNARHPTPSPSIFTPTQG